MDAVEAGYAAHAGVVTILAFALAILGIIISVYYGIDARRQRSLADRLAEHQRVTIEGLNNFLLAMKGWVAVDILAVNDRLLYIKQRNKEFDDIAKEG